jgi:hypothetical protein
MPHRLYTFAFLSSAILFMGCASTTMRSVHREPGFRSGDIHHVLIIGVFQNQGNRKAFEDEFVRQWSRRGVQAASSLEVLPPSTSLDKNGVAPIAKAKGFDTVLVTRLLERKKIEPGQLAVPDISVPQPNDLQNSNNVWQTLLAPPVSTEAHDLVTLETNLYDVAAEKPIWSGWSETAVMSKVPKLIPPFVRLILKRLYD